MAADDAPHPSPVAFLKAVLRETQEKQITFAAAAIAYYGLVSLVPMVFLSFILLTTFSGADVAQYVLLSLADILTPQGTELVADLITESAGKGSLTFIGTFFLFWGAYRLFSALDEGFAQVYDRKCHDSPFEKAIETIKAFFMVSLAIIITAGAGAAITRLPHIQFVGVISTVAQLVTLVIVFLPLYYIFSADTYSVRKVLPGAVTAAFGWTVLQILFVLYTQMIGSTVYGVFGSVLLLVVWMYAASILLLLGAVVNHVLNDAA